jgi:NAD(P)-dependent dehydrogenase (short-subunit alcohol dehydrogenase family)
MLIAMAQSAEVQSAERSVIVTGGTGALGRKVVEAFLAAGDRVTVPWIVEQEAAELGGHERLVLVEADVAEEAGAAQVVAVSGRVDVLVNGVGGFGGGADVHETELELWDKLYRMNVRSAAAMSRAALPCMLEAGAGVIINIASRAADDCPAGIAAYSASKAAVAALTRSLHSEVSERGVRVNAVVPTTIDTPANRVAMPDADFSSWTPPEEIARVMLWLAGDEGRTVRGGLIPV